MTANPLSWLLQSLIKVYRLVPKRAETCRYYPSCSAYGLESLQVHGVIKGTWLTLRRVGRCHPWGGTGIDPVPPRKGHADNDSEVPEAFNRSRTEYPVPAGGPSAHREEHT